MPVLSFYGIVKTQSGNFARRGSFSNADRSYLRRILNADVLGPGGSELINFNSSAPSCSSAKYGVPGNLMRVILLPNMKHGTGPQTGRVNGLFREKFLKDNETDEY